MQKNPYLILGVSENATFAELQDAYTKLQNKYKAERFLEGEAGAEAIRKLELEGLVIMIPRKGAEVAHITEKDMRDVLEVRCTLEELAVLLACKNVNAEHIAALKAANKVFEMAIVSKDVVNIV